MAKGSSLRDTPDELSNTSIVPLALASLLVGAATGFIGAAFRLCLDQVALFRNVFIERAHDEGALGLPVVVATCAVATALAAWLVRRFAPRASGSGIPHTEAVLDGELPPAPYLLIPITLWAAFWPSAPGWRLVAKDRACRWVRASPT